MVKRLVGYYEYLNALERLGQLASSLAADERKELDAYIAERDLFAVEVNLSKKLQVGNSMVSDPPDAEEEQRGLSWMTALARVELGAMLAGYTKVPRPFEAVRPTPDDIEAYRYLLLDGVRSHYWALKTDPSVGYLLKSKEIMKVLAYTRRMIMVRSMLNTLARSGKEWTFPETQELSGWKSEMDAVQGGLVAYVRSYLYQHVESGQATRTRDFSYSSRVCGAILDGAAAELAAGTATQTTSTSDYEFGNVGAPAE